MPLPKSYEDFAKAQAEYTEKHNVKGIMARLLKHVMINQPDDPLSAMIDLVRKGSAIKEPLKVILAGAPASGKGTQCAMIVEEFGLVHVSTGDLLRAAVKEGSELGMKAKEAMEAGKLVPDEVVCGMVEERLNQEDAKKQGWLLDGFPRTRLQALKLQEAGLIPSHVIVLDVPDEALVERVTGRRTDSETGAIYHMKFNPPPADVPAERLIQRKDDNEETVKVRVATYHENLQGILSCYSQLLIRVDGNRDKSEVWNDLGALLRGPGGPSIKDPALDTPPATPKNAAQISVM